VEFLHVWVGMIANKKPENYLVGYTRFLSGRDCEMGTY